MDCVIYARVSGEKQNRDNKVSISEQLTDCRRLASEAAYTVVEEIIDAAKYRSESGRMVQPSGTRLDRPGLRRLLELVKAKRVGAVIVWAQDRLGRGASVISVFRDAVEAAGCEVRFVIGAWDADTSELLGAVSGMELRRIKARIRMGNIGSVKRGLHIGPPPYGYRQTRNSEGERIGYEIVLSESETLRQAARLYVQHISLKKIANALPPNRRGKRWTDVSVGRLFRNPFYFGIVEWGDQRAKGTQPLVWSESERRAIQKENEWRSVHRLDRPRDNGHVYALAGVLRCGVCGNVMSGRRKTVNGKEFRAYFCWRYQAARFGNSQHAPNHISEIKALKQISAIIGSLTDADFEAAIAEAEQPTRVMTAAGLEALRARESELRKLIELNRAAGVPAAVRPLEAELARVISEAEGAGAEQALAVVADKAELLARMRSARDLFAVGGWERMDSAELSRVLMESFKVFTVQNGAIRVGE